MKTIFAALILSLVLYTTANADTYCQWNGTTPILETCKATKTVLDGSLRAKIDGVWRVVTAESALEHGYYKMIDVQPAFNSATQRLGDVKYTFASNQITRTWAVVSLTAGELAVLAEQQNLDTELISLVATMSYADIATHVNTTFSGLTTAQKNSLIKLYRVVLYLAKQQGNP